MDVGFLTVFVALLVTKSLCLEADPRTSSNVTVMGTVFCDACCNNNFTKHSYFLEGVKVRVICNFRVNSTSSQEISIIADRTTDKFGVYKIDIPPVDGFECRQGRQLHSFCRSFLIGSPSLLCNVPGLSSSTEHVALKTTEPNMCLYNLNALHYRPSKKDANLCGTGTRTDIVIDTQLLSSSSLNTSLFLWPPFPPFWCPWPQWPPLPFPFPFPNPPSLPFPFPPIPFLTPPPAFPFPFPPIPFFTPPPPVFPFPFPPVFPTPTSPVFPPLPQLPPLPFLTPPPPPPSFPFPLPPIFPPFTPLPPFVTPSPPPPPPPSFPIPFPPIPFLPIPSPPPPPPPSPAFSWTDPRTWFPYHPPSSPNEP